MVFPRGVKRGDASHRRASDRFGATKAIPSTQAEWPKRVLVHATPRQGFSGDGPVRVVTLWEKPEARLPIL
jgi:hypothetical protein